MSNKITIANDVLDIAQRIKEIDGDYFVVFDRERNRFEVYNRSQRGNTLALVLPYDTLDERAVVHVRKTSVANVMAQISETEGQNERVDSG